MPKMSKLTPKQQRFIEEYAKDLNGKQAAIRTGFSPRTAKVQASRLLTNVNVRERSEQAQKKRFGAYAPTTHEISPELLVVEDASRPRQCADEEAVCSAQSASQPAN